MKAKILLIYTGGTIGMIKDLRTGELKSLDFNYVFDHIPELERLHVDLSSISFEKAIDSSDMTSAHWKQLVDIINDNYETYDGFVVLHGSDTMAYTASALSFMLQGLNKPIILTGSQLPIGTIRTDGKENLITAVEIAAAKNKDVIVCHIIELGKEEVKYKTEETGELVYEFESANKASLTIRGKRGTGLISSLKNPGKNSWMGCLEL